jgi:hypothetical protein
MKAKIGAEEDAFVVGVEDAHPELLVHLPDVGPGRLPSL